MGVMGITGDVAASSHEPIYSTMSSRADMLPLVVDFVGSARRAAGDLHKAARAGNLPGCRAVCVNLRGGGASFGFDAVTEAAAEVLAVLDRTGSTEEAAPLVRRFEALCGRLSGDAAA